MALRARATPRNYRLRAPAESGVTRTWHQLWTRRKSRDYPDFHKETGLLRMIDIDPVLAQELIEQRPGEPPISGEIVEAVSTPRSHAITPWSRREPQGHDQA